LYCVYCGFLLAAFAAGFVVFHVDTRATAGDQSTAKSFRNGLQGHDFKRAQAARTSSGAFWLNPRRGTGSDSESKVGRIGDKNRFGFSVGMVHRLGFQIRHQDTLDRNRLAVDRDRPLRVRPSRHLLHDVHAE
jgi:hypothetical protein